eukprot:Clim_evm11s242 gene=Clim_evmTU11s242
MVQQQNTLRPLYGGAFSVRLPPGFLDVSTFREIPDNQEVFNHENSDQSIMFDILEWQDVPDEQSAKVHFDELAKCNDSTENARSGDTRELTDQEMPGAPSLRKFYIRGFQEVGKYKETVRNLVDVHLVVIRIPEKQTDIVISLNDPKVINPESSSNLPQIATRAPPAELDDFKNILESFTINDLSILG